MGAKEKVAAGAIRNRIVGEAMVDPSTLTAHPDNFRTHPAEQREAMGDILVEVGWLARVVVNERTGHVLDGHLRIEEALARGEKAVPVTYVDVDEAEEAEVLATFDPVGSLAGMDAKALARVLVNVDPVGVGLQRLIATLEEAVGVGDAKGDGDGGETTLLDQSVQLEPGKEYVVVVCNSEDEFTKMREVLGLRAVRRGGYKPGSPFDDVGTERVVTFRRFMGAMAGTPHVEDLAKEVAAERASGSTAAQGRGAKRAKPSHRKRGR